MKLVFSNAIKIDLGINNTELSETYKKIYKNLCHATLEFREWDNPYYKDRLTYEQIVDRLELYGQRVSVVVDKSRCLAYDQTHYNDLHKIYEMNYNGNPAWLDFHEHIHACEHYYDQHRVRILDIDYREKAGMLEKPFNLSWLKHSSAQVNAGDVFVSWAELGKTPYQYWLNKEPNDIKRMCQLAKPWLKLRPKIKIAIEDIDELKDKQVQEFESWWKDYQAEWCQHWGLESWTLNDIYSNAIIGHIDDVAELQTLLKNNINPVGVSMT